MFTFLRLSIIDPLILFDLQCFYSFFVPLFVSVSFLHTFDDDIHIYIYLSFSKNPVSSFKSVTYSIQAC